MQAKMNDGTYGLPVEFNQKGLDALLKDKNVDHVEVFEGTPEEIKKRKKYKISRGFRKTPRVEKRVDLKMDVNIGSKRNSKKL